MASRFTLWRRCPHARGGEPASDPAIDEGLTRCPHARGGEPVQSPRIAAFIAGCPHARGGEPFERLHPNTALIVVPTPVGVNLTIDNGGEETYPVVPTPVGVNRGYL